MKYRRACTAGAVLAMTVSLIACGGDDSGGGAEKPASGGEQQAQTSGAKVIDVKAMDGASGTVNWCIGKDASGAYRDAVESFNEANQADGLSVKLIEFPESADEQRSQFTQRQRARSADCDVFGSDVIWTAEFASQKWLYDLTPYVEQRRNEFIPSTFETAQYEERVWGVPYVTNTALMFYRTDQIEQPPGTWQDAYRSAKTADGVVYQGAPYEGLTCVFLELAYAAGGEVLSNDGTKPVINSPENLRALEFMVDGLQNGVAPKAVTTYMEEEARRAFEAGRASLMRNWTYAYALAQEAPKTQGSFAVLPLPTFEGGGKAGILGGANLVISAYSKNPGGALKFIDHATSPEVQARMGAQYAMAPTLADAYDDAQLQKAIPFAAELRDAIEQARARPVSPVYPQLSQAIYQNVNRALAGQTTPQAALEAADAEMTQALKTF